jgi:hypothetical protein
MVEGIDNVPLRRLTGSPTMTALFTRTIRQALLIAAVAVSFSALSTPSFAWTAETRQMCTSDAWRLCSSTIPNIGATEACMSKQRSSLSAGCRTAVEKERAAQRTPSVAAK